MKNLLLGLAAVLVFVAGCAAPATYQNMSVAELKESLDAKDFFLVDVHIPEQKHIAGTDLFVPFDKIKQNLDKLPADKNEMLIIYCRSGRMSIDASQNLVALGYKNVFNVEGGINAWKAAGYPVE